MTTINSQEDFLRALRENPEWKEAVRAMILGEELLQLPTRFNAFVDEQRQVNKRVESDISDLKAGQARLEAGQDELRAGLTRLEGGQEELRGGLDEVRAGQARIEARMDRQEYDSSTLKGWYASSVIARSAESLPADMGLDYVRTLSETDLGRMVRAARPELPLNEVRSFRRADLVVEARDDSGTVYIVVEASYTADLRDSRRAQRNAQMLTEFTGHRATPVIASVRNANEVSELVDSGAIHWYEIEERYLARE